MTVLPLVSATLALLSSVSDAVPETGVVVVLVHRDAAGHVVSPPPLTVAVLLAVVPAMAACAVTGMTKLALAPTPSPVATVQLTFWPAAVHPAGSVPMLSPVGIGSVTTAAAVVAAVPVLVTLSV